jgi:hypothetical protein
MLHVDGPVRSRHLSARYSPTPRITLILLEGVLFDKLPRPTDIFVPTISPFMHQNSHFQSKRNTLLLPKPISRLFQPLEILFDFLQTLLHLVLFCLVHYRYVRFSHSPTILIRQFIFFDIGLEEDCISSWIPSIVPCGRSRTVTMTPLLLIFLGSPTNTSQLFVF